MSTVTASSCAHWNIDFDEHNIAWLHLDMADSKVNLLASTVLEELRGILEELAKDLPQGVIIYSGKKGSFILQHFGTMKNGKDRLILEVVPDSGTNQLSGLAGKMVINIDNGQHFYEFEYELE